MISKHESMYGMRKLDFKQFYQPTRHHNTLTIKAIDMQFLHNGNGINNANVCDCQTWKGHSHTWQIGSIRLLSKQ